MDRTLLGEARQFTVGDRRIEIGWHRANDAFRDTDYDTRPYAYIRTATAGRAVKKGEIGMTPTRLRALAAALKTIETAQVEYDARHAAVE